ncbi:MAG: RNA polymerase sigma factor, partial [Acidobacteriota bacterium]
MGSPAYVQKRERVEEVERDLVVRARGGDKGAFESIVRTYQRRVYGVALRMTRQHEVADDITQETFLRAYTHLHRFEVGRPLAPWLLRIARNLCINHLTRPERRDESLDDESRPDRPALDQGALPEHRNNPLQILVSSDFCRALEEAVQKLPAEQKAVFVLKVHEEMRYEEIAETL